MPRRSRSWPPITAICGPAVLLRKHLLPPRRSIATTASAPAPVRRLSSVSVRGTRRFDRPLELTADDPSLDVQPVGDGNLRRLPELQTERAIGQGQAEAPHVVCSHGLDPALAVRQRDEIAT